jgi:hypothetical protein
MLKKLRVMLIGTVLAGTVLGADSSHDVTYVGLDNRLVRWHQALIEVICSRWI